MRLLFTVTLFVGCIAALSEVLYQDAFVGWMQRHQKSYSHDDFHHRYQIFRTNLDFIEESNAKEGSHKLAMNHLGDLTTEEFKKFYLGTRISFDDVPEVPPRLNAVYQNDTKDWRRVGAVTPVKNQAQCGSCWAFSATGAAEGCHYMKSKELVSLSEQNLMDCSVSYGNHGCNGGLMENAFDYIIKNGGIDTEDSYPYTAKDGSCHYDPSHSAATLTKYSRVPKGDEGALLEALQEGPVAVAIDASQTTFHFYKSGVYDEPACSSTNLDHGVLAVGYGHEDGKDYWLVKNSWGETWGEGGYIKMARNAKNQCGIATMATLPHC